MPRCRSNTRLRGNAILKRIVIAGFSPSLTIENGKKIQNWTDGLREKLILDAYKLREVANLHTSTRQPVLPNEKTDPSVSAHEMTHDRRQIFGEPESDYDMEDSETDCFEFIECDSETGSPFWENTTLQ
jgi:hypothetical protein